MNFFKSLSNLEFEGNLMIVVRKTPSGELAVTSYLHNQSVADRAKKAIPPLTFCNTPQELDNEFFDALNANIPKANTLLVSMSNYEKGLAEAKAKSAQVNAQQQVEKKERDTQKSKFDSLIKTVKELEAENKFRQAFAKLPDPADLPFFATQIETKKKELLSKFEQPSLFDSIQPAEKAVQHTDLITQ